MSGTPEAMERKGKDRRRVGAARWVRFAATVLLLALLGVAYLFSETFRGEVDRGVAVLASGDPAVMRDYLLSYGAWAPVVSAGLMVLQALAAFVPSFVVGFANGLAFGVFWGGTLSLVSAALAAGLCFGIARAVGRTPIEALVGKRTLGSTDRWFARYGAYAILVARLVPFVSFDAVSYAAGLTRMGFLRFLAATTVGMAPACYVYAYLGDRALGNANLFLAAFGIFVAVAVVAAVIQRRRWGKPV